MLEENKLYLCILPTATVLGSFVLWCVWGKDPPAFWRGSYKLTVPSSAWQLYAAVHKTEVIMAVGKENGRSAWLPGPLYLLGIS